MSASSDAQQPEVAEAPSGFGRPERSDQQVARVLWIVLALNLVVAGLKLSIGLWAGAVALIADGVHSLLDGSSNVVGLVGLRAAAKPPDPGHPYGHRRYEALSAAGIGVLILLGFVGIAQSIVERFSVQSEPPRVGPWSVVVVALTIVVNLGISRYESRRGRELSSRLLEADSQHTLSDAVAAGIVLVSFAGSAAGLPWADVVAATIVCAFIGRTGWLVVQEAFQSLADAAQLDPGAVYDCVVAVPDVLGAHKIRSRGLASHIHVDFHIQLDPNLSLHQAHQITHRVAAAVRARFPGVEDVVIHTEPAKHLEYRAHSPQGGADD
jgi:cation diffusion facilitator family transporter